MEKSKTELENLKIEFIAFMMQDKGIVYNDIWNFFLKHLTPKDEWISVEDRLPEKHTYVLVDTPFCTNKSSVAYYNGIEWHSTDNMEVWNIKFWQPLPIKK